MLELKPQLVKCFASVSPNCFCQFGVSLASDTGQTIATSVVRFTLADDTCGCHKIKNMFSMQNRAKADQLINPATLHQKHLNDKERENFISPFFFSTCRKLEYNNNNKKEHLKSTIILLD
jgi:hypothetical protein